MASIHVYRVYVLGLGPMLAQRLEVQNMQGGCTQLFSIRLLLGQPPGACNVKINITISNP